MKKNSDKFIIIGFFSILFGIFILYPLNFFLLHKGILINNFTNSYNLKNENSIDAKIYNLKNKVETLTTNYFPLANQINIYYRGLKNNTNQFLYDVTGHDFTYLGTNSDKEYIYQNIDSNYYIVQNNLSKQVLEKRFNELLNLYNKIGLLKDTTIFLPNRYEFQNLLDRNMAVLNMSSFLDEFKTKLNPKIKLFELNVNENEYQDLFYHTDHHWNAYGAKMGYEIIMPLLNKTPLNLEVKTIEDIEYHGSIAKSSGNIKNHDYLTYLDNASLLKPSELVASKLDSHFKPLTVTKRKEIFYDYYVSFFDGMYPYVYYNNPKGEENLLIIGDSYSWQLDYIFANSFKKTITLNPRYIDAIDYEKFLEEEQIDKVLILMETQTTLFDQYNYGILEKLGGK